jgi:transposase InsO family protein
VLAIHGNRRRFGVHLAELHLTPKNPSARWTSALARRVAHDLSVHGWKLEAVSTDNASEFRSAEFATALRAAHARHLFIRAGRPQSNGYVERAQKTILDECWKPAFARYLIPQIHGVAARPRSLRAPLRMKVKSGGGPLAPCATMTGVRVTPD